MYDSAHPLSSRNREGTIVVAQPRACLYGFITLDIPLPAASIGLQTPRQKLTAFHLPDRGQQKVRKEMSVD